MKNSEHTLYDNKFMYYYLSGIEGIGAAAIIKLHAECDNLSDLFNYSRTELKDMDILSDIQIASFLMSLGRIEEKYKEYEDLLMSDIKYCAYFEERYPAKLREIPYPPAVLFYKGDLPDINMPTVAIIGSRAATSYGLSVSEYFGKCLAEEGVGVISGMAHGIDGSAHRGALESRNGKTFAVLGGGVNIIYPRENAYIYERIIDDNRGGVISEMLPGTNAISRNFPMRNRIISGLADAVLVVEAREKSGSLITVETALEQGKDILAIPGRITDPMSKGCNALISSGAVIVNSPEDVMNTINLAPLYNLNTNEKKYLLAKNEKIVYSTLDSEPKHVEEIVFITGLSYQEVIRILIELEIKGLAIQISSNYYGCKLEI